MYVDRRMCASKGVGSLATLGCPGSLKRDAAQKATYAEAVKNAREPQSGQEAINELDHA